MPTRSEEFERLMKKREEDKKKKATKTTTNYGNNSYQFEEVAYVALDTDVDKVVRIVSPFLGSKLPGAVKEVYITGYLLGDDGKTHKVIWPDHKVKPDYFLWKVFNKVLEFTWDKDENGKSFKVFKNEKKYPELFNRVYKNNQPDNAKEKGWYPQKYVLMNVIDREDYDWHKINKKLKLISKKATLGSEDAVFYEPGVPAALWTSLVEDVIEPYGDYADYDVVLRKSGTGTDTTYKAFNCFEERKKVRNGKEQYIVPGPLTDEELSWSFVNTDKAFKVTSYRKIKKILGIFIEQVDATLGTRFFDELEKLVAYEIEQIKKLAEQNTNESSATVSAVSSEPIKKVEPKIEQGNKVETTSAPTPTRKRSEPVKVEAIKVELDLSGYVGVEFLSDENKAMIVGINNDGTLVYDVSSVKDDTSKSQLYACNEDGCGFQSPGAFEACPMCGYKF